MRISLTAKFLLFHLLFSSCLFTLLYVFIDPNMWMSLIALNISSTLCMLADKFLSTTPLTRIPENALLIMSAFFGSLGVLIGIQFFRHKSNKFTFLFPFTIILLLQIGLLLYYIPNRIQAHAIL